MSIWPLNRKMEAAQRMEKASQRRERERGISTGSSVLPKKSLIARCRHRTALSGVKLDSVIVSLLDIPSVTARIPQRRINAAAGRFPEESSPTASAGRVMELETANGSSHRMIVLGASMRDRFSISTKVKSGAPFGRKHRRSPIKATVQFLKRISCTEATLFRFSKPPRTKIETKSKLLSNRNGQSACYH